ncbi:MAG: peptide chain release factor N(5)-glutamine methyltransferase [Acidobacteriota bacterium]
MSSIATLLREAVRQLEAAAVAEPRRDAEILLARVLERDRAFLLAHPEQSVSEAETGRFQGWVRRRASHYPIQYLLGFQEFFGRPFEVDERVLIPRPETELVVETALHLLEALPAPRIVDVGTGSGCIAVTLACERTDAALVATELSPGALEVARHNARRHGVLGRIDFRLGSVLEPLRGEPRFDLIVSNPPYVSRGDTRVTREVDRHEPHQAVYAGATGLEVQEQLFAQAPPLLNDGGRLVLEIGAGQRACVTALADAHRWRLVEVRHDLAGIERCLIFVI